MHRFIPMRTHDKKRTYDIIKVVPFISDEDRYEELTPFPLANLKHHPVESCGVKLRALLFGKRTLFILNSHLYINQKIHPKEHGLRLGL